MQVVLLLLCAVLLGACQTAPNDFYHPPVPGEGPRRGGDPPPITGSGGGAVTPDARQPDPPDSGVDLPPTATDMRPPASEVSPAPDATAVVDAVPVIDTTPPVDTVILPQCKPPLPGEIDLWISGQGNCSYPVSGLPEFTAAVDRDLYAQGAACGSCLEVTSDRGTVIATVVDQYPVGPSSVGHKISLGRAALDKVAAPGTSVARMRWRWAPCPVSGPIMGALKNGSHQFYWALMIQSAVNRVVKVESLTGTDKVWRLARLESDGFFLGDSTIVGLPSQIRLTDSAGGVVTTGPVMWGAPVTRPVSLGVQFAPACTL